MEAAGLGKRQVVSAPWGILRDGWVQMWGSLAGAQLQIREAVSYLSRRSHLGLLHKPLV